MSLNAQRFARTHKHAIHTGNMAPMFIEPAPALISAAETFCLSPFSTPVIARCGRGELVFQPSFRVSTFKRRSGATIRTYTCVQ
jgi:hypothetical protein